MIKLIKGKVYKLETGTFPFNTPHAIYVETVKSGFNRFVWDGKDFLMNPEGYKYEQKSK